MRVLIRRFWRGERAQDLIEYTLLVAFIAIGSAALFNQSGGSISSVWSATNAALTGNPGANQAPSGSGSTGTTGTTDTGTTSTGTTNTGSGTGGTGSGDHHDDRH